MSASRAMQRRRQKIMNTPSVKRDMREVRRVAEFPQSTDGDLRAVVADFMEKHPLVAEWTGMGVWLQHTLAQRALQRERHSALERGALRANIMKGVRHDG